MEIYSKGHLSKALKAVKELRELSGGTDRSLADMLKIHPTNVWLWRNGKQKVPIKHLLRIRILFKRYQFNEERLRPDIYR